MNDFLQEVADEVLDKVEEWPEVDAELILDKIASPVLMDLMNINKRGTSPTLITETISEKIMAFETVIEVLKGIHEHSIILFETDD